MSAPVMTSQLLIKRISAHATLPTRGSAFAAGLDLYAAEPIEVPARGKALVDLGLSMSIPLGTYGRVAPRSGLASKHSLSTGAGVIDADYRGPVFVLLFNHSDVAYPVTRGERVAQLILEKCEYAAVEEVEELDSTVRGAGGFGSTGGFGAALASSAAAASTAAGQVGEAVVDAAAKAKEAVAGAGAAGKDA